MSLVTKVIVIDGEPHIERIWKKRCENGDIIEIRELPVKNFNANGTYSIVIDKQEKLLCKLETSSCGCVLPTKENKVKILTYCGACIIGCTTGSKCDTDIPKTPTNSGTIKIEGNRIFINSDSNWVILSYQTNGECPGEEILIPEYAVMAMMAGIDFRTKAFRPSGSRISPQEKILAKNEYEDQKIQLFKFLNPIRPDEFVRASYIIPKWGGSYHSGAPIKKNYVSGIYSRQENSNNSLLYDIGKLLDNKLQDFGDTTTTININDGNLIEDEW
jgi:hypothetical protein